MEPQSVTCVVVCFQVLSSVPWSVGHFYCSSVITLETWKWDASALFRLALCCCFQFLLHLFSFHVLCTPQRSCGGQRTAWHDPFSHSTSESWGLDSRRQACIQHLYLVPLPLHIFKGKIYVAYFPLPSLPSVPLIPPRPIHGLFFFNYCYL